MVRISKLVIHEVPKGRYSADNQQQVDCSEAESDLVPDTRRFVEENMLDFALKKPRKIIEDPSNSSTTPNLVRQILSDPTRYFIENSQKLAQNLFQAQTSNSPSGMFVVAITRSSDSSPSSLVIMKAEHQEGMRLRRVEGEGPGRFDLEHLHELIIGNNSRVYKVAKLHVQDDHVHGEMVDQQNGVAFADFFLSSFLGCRLAENAEVQTKQFMDSAFRFINAEVSDPVKQGDYARALVTYSVAQNETMQASEFADQYLDPEHRDGFLDSIPEDIGDQVFTKDLSLVPGRGRGLRLYGEGISISASSDALERGALSVTTGEAGETVIRVSGSLRKLGLASVSAK